MKKTHRDEGVRKIGLILEHERRHRGQTGDGFDSEFAGPQELAEALGSLAIIPQPMRASAMTDSQVTTGRGSREKTREHHR
jgi:hypothetical protein